MMTTISLLLCLSSVARSQGAPADPKTILGAMVARYSSCASYQDSGLVRTLPGESLRAGGAEGSLLLSASAAADGVLVSFKTYFARPRLFRFEWRSSSIPASREAAVWSDGKKDYRWMPEVFPKSDRFMLYDGAPLRFNVDDALKSSSGAIFFIPSLLMEDIAPIPFGELLEHMTELSLLPEERIDGEACYVIGGRISAAPWTLWVGKETHLLRKTRTLYTSASFHETLKKGLVKSYTAEEIHRDIKIDEKIPEETFRHKPQIRADDIDLTR